MATTDVQTPHNRQTRWLRRVTTAAVVGLAVTITVAWGLALWYPADTTVPSTEYGRRVLRPRVQKTPGRTIDVRIWRQFGATHYFGSIGPGWDVGPGTPTPEQVVPTWATTHVIPWSGDQEAEASNELNESRRIVAYGWPFPALWCRLDVTRNELGNYRARAAGGVLLRAHSPLAPSALRFPPTLPFQPCWPGFVANFLFAVGACLALPAVWTAIRARLIIPPGHCRHCRYDLRANVFPVCPECGNPAPVTAPAPTAPSLTP